jgi:threonine/homoserine/homoserine lactone efflux protein
MHAAIVQACLYTVPMFPLETLAAYLVAVILVVFAPGPDNILAISRGLSQGRMAATLSSVGAGLGIMVHTVAAALGLTLVIQASPLAFWVVKGVGAAYLLWLGYRALASRNLISFTPAAKQPLGKVFAIGLFSNVLNPKPGLFALAFIPQFVDATRGPVHVQMLVLGAIFAVLTAVIFSVLGSCAAGLSQWLERRPRATTWLNYGAGATFIASGISILALGNRR